MDHDVVDSAIDVALPTCPPPEPYGLEVGDRVTNLSWNDCEGEAVNIYDGCGERATLLVNFYGWCASCYRYLEIANRLDATYEAQGLRVIVAVSEDALHSPATDAYCAEIRAGEMLETMVVSDPTLQLEAYGDADLTMVVDPFGQIVLKRQGATEAAIEAAIRTALH